jgi:uncharacterized protein YbbK (DUF523 family)
VSPADHDRGLDRILVSACLLGRPVRWDGSAKTVDDAHLARWAEEGRLVPICPEIAAGLPTPRPAVEIAPGATAEDVAAGRADVIDAEGGVWSEAMREGARLAVEAAREHGCRFALLAEGSPSCGSHAIADGRFSGTRIPGEGLAARALRAAGVEVFAPEGLARLAARLDHRP